MTRKVAGNNSWETENRDDGMERHEERVAWTPECCLKRINCGCCPCRRDPELDEILRDKIIADVLADMAEEELRSGLYDEEDIYVSESDDGDSALPDVGDSYEIQF